MPAASRLKQPLDELCRELNWAARVEQDAIQFPARYRDPADIELVGLFAACMAYGRVDLFGPWISWVLERMGDSPARFVESFDLERDVLAFCLAARKLLLRHGSLEAFFLEGYSSAHAHVGFALEHFSQGFLDQDLSPIFPRRRLP